MNSLHVDLTRMMSLENGLAVTVRKAADDVARAECFDAEQRSEVYAILEAIRSNSMAHSIKVRQLTERIKAGDCDA